MSCRTMPVVPVVKRQGQSACPKTGGEGSNQNGPINWFQRRRPSRRPPRRCSPPSPCLAPCLYDPLCLRSFHAVFQISCLWSARPNPSHHLPLTWQIHDGSPSPCLSSCHCSFEKPHAPTRTHPGRDLLLCLDSLLGSALHRA
jgi:hypothetical protein